MSVASLVEQWGRKLNETYEQKVAEEGYDQFGYEFRRRITAMSVMKVAEGSGGVH